MNERILPPKFSTSELCAYYKERYEEVKTTFRRLEDKVNYLLAALAMEISVLVAIFGAASDVFNNLEKLSVKLFILFSVFCCAHIVLSMYFLGKAWELKTIPKMPTPEKQQEHDALLIIDEVDAHRHLIVLYCRAVREIEKLHKAKACYVNNLFLSLALSFAFFIISTFSLILGKF